MNGGKILAVLVVVNVALAAMMLVGFKREARVAGNPVSSENARMVQTDLGTHNESASARVAPVAEKPAQSPGTSNAPATAFTRIYSNDTKEFVANLRRIHCPEETIKDILTAEVHRRFQEQEKALRPTPADHVPFAWSARTSEPRLLERREQAAALSRDESTMLRGALSCELTVPMPLYAMTLSDQQFQAALAESINACAIRDVQDAYWAEVQALQQRTKGFWLPDDVTELEAIKAKRRQALAALVPPQ